MKKINTILAGAAIAATVSVNAESLLSFLSNETSRQQQVSVNNLKQIGIALEFYSLTSVGQHRPNGMLRSGFDTRQDASAVFDILRREGHLTDAKVYLAPWDKEGSPAKPGRRINNSNTSYIYIYVSPQYSITAPVCFEKPWLLPRGSNKLTVLYADGHVSTVTIPGVSNMSCREILTLLLQNSGINESSKQEMLKYADLADRSK